MTKESVAAGDLANLGLGDSATRSVGITTGTVAAGNDSRIVNAISKLDENISLPGNLTSKGTATAFKLVADYGSKTGIIYADGDVEGLRWGTSGSTGRLYTYISGIKTAADNSFQRKGDLGTADLNVIGTPAQCGTWFQKLSGSATSLRNYPANEAGTLLVNRPGFRRHFFAS